MKAYHNTAVLKFDDETTGNAASGVPVTIRINNTQALASIFDLNEIATANPLTTDSNGNYAFKANDAIYDIIVSEGTANEVKLEKVEIAEIPIPSALINDLSQSYEFPTVAVYKAFTTAFPVGKVVNLLDRKAGFTVISGAGTGEDEVASNEVSQSLTLSKTDTTHTEQWGLIGSGDETAIVKAAIEDKKNTIFDKTLTQNITSISLNDSIYLQDANLSFSGTNAGFDIDTAIDGLEMHNTKLTGDGVLASSQKGITSNEALTNGVFTNVTLDGFQQGFDLNSAVNTRFVYGLVKNSVGEAAGQGYGIIAGSSQRGVFANSAYEQCQRHALYLNNSLYSVVASNVFYKHRDGLATGGGLGALQLAGQAKGIPAIGNSFALNTGPEIAVSPQPTNTSPEECILTSSNTHYLGQSVSVRYGGATPSATEIVKGASTVSSIFQPAQDSSGGTIQVYSGFGINASHNMFYLKGGTGASPVAIRIGLTTPDDAYFDNLSYCGNNGIWTGDSGQAKFFQIAEEVCLGTTRIDIFDNHVETDLLIDYAVTPTNPNIRTDWQKEKAITLVAGAQDLNIAGHNNFVLTGDAAGSTINNFINGHEDKCIRIRINDVHVITMTSTGNKSLGGTFNSTNKDIIKFEEIAGVYREQTRSLNT